MEKFGLVEKTKDELIEIALEQKEIEKRLRDDLNDANVRLTKTTKELKRANRLVSGFSIIYILMCISITYLLLKH